MRNIIEAINTLNRYNEMSLEKFCKKLYKKLRIEVPEASIEEWKFTGLNNVDFFKMSIMPLITPFSYAWWKLVVKRMEKEWGQMVCDGEPVYSFAKYRLKCCKSGDYSKTFQQYVQEYVEKWEQKSR